LGDFFKVSPELSTRDDIETESHGTKPAFSLTPHFSGVFVTARLMKPFLTVSSSGLSRPIARFDSQEEDLQGELKVLVAAHALDRHDEPEG